MIIIDKNVEGLRVKRKIERKVWMGGIFVDVVGLMVGREVG